jgi:hypothetical protein
MSSWHPNLITPLNSMLHFQEKNHKCEALKLDLDAQRKSVSAAEGEL